MLTNSIRFWSYLVPLVPSFFCLLFVLYHLLFDRTLRQALNNHVIILLLVINLVFEVTMYPWMLYYFGKERNWPRSLVFCEIWDFIDWGLYITHTVLFAWATLERHILIFHSQWLSTRKKRFFVHYLPILFLLLYCLIFYGFMMFFPPCQNSYVPSTWICISPCMFDVYAFYMYETIVHEIVPVLIIVVASIALLVRVVVQKSRMRRSIEWQKYRKMTIQLLSISFLYMVFVFPLALRNVLSLSGVTSILFTNIYWYASFLSYFMELVFPFVCIFPLPELRGKLLNMLHLRRQARRVGPEAFVIRVRRNRHAQNQ